VLDLEHLREWIRQSDEGAAQELSDHTICQRLLERLEVLGIAGAKRDVVSFIVNQGVLNIWSKGYFSQVVKLMAIQACHN